MAKESSANQNDVEEKRSTSTPDSLEVIIIRNVQKRGVDMAVLKETEHQPNASIAGMILTS